MNPSAKQGKPPPQLQTTQALQRVHARIRKLDAIFGPSGKAKWWNAFKQGPLTYWLRYYFGNDEVGLWEAVHATIADILDNNLKTTSERAGELQKRLMVLESETESTKKMRDAQMIFHNKLLALAKKERKMPERLQRISDGEIAGAFVDWCL